MFYFSSFSKRFYTSKHEYTHADVSRLHDELYMSMEGHLKTEHQPHKQEEMAIDESGVTNESRLMTLDRFLVEMSMEELEAFFQKDEFDLMEQKDDGTLVKLSEQEVRSRWEYLNSRKKNDPFLANRLPHGKPLQQETDVKKMEVPLKPTHVASKIDESFDQERGKAVMDKKKIDPNILNVIKSQESSIKTSVASAANNSLKQSLEQLQKRQQNRLKIGDVIPFLRTQRNRNIAQTALMTFGFIGCLGYYFSREDWLPKRVTREDMDNALKEIQELRNEYSTKSQNI